MKVIEAKTINRESVNIILDEELISTVTKLVRAQGVADFRFDFNLAEGKVGETMLAQLLEGKKIEVKRDFVVSRTGNLAVEFSARKKPSGISISEADWWAFVLAGEQYNDEVVILTKKARLLRALEGTRTLKGGDKDGGTEGVAEFFVLPVTKLISKMKGKS